MMCECDLSQGVYGRPAIPAFGVGDAMQYMLTEGWPWSDVFLLFLSIPQVLKDFAAAAQVEAVHGRRPGRDGRAQCVI